MTRAVRAACKSKFKIGKIETTNEVLFSHLMMVSIAIGADLFLWREQRLLFSLDAAHLFAAATRGRVPTDNRFSRTA